VTAAAAKDGEACLAIIKQSNDLNEQISAVQKKADDEEECHAEAKLWGQAIALVNKKIQMEARVREICAGFTVTGGRSAEELKTKAIKMQGWQASAQKDCDPPVAAQAPKSSDTGLIGSGTITCFGGGDCKQRSSNGSGQINGSPIKPAPATNKSTITGREFGDKAPPSTGSTLVAPAR
jgi:hypothetical protein